MVFSYRTLQKLTLALLILLISDTAFSEPKVWLFKTSLTGAFNQRIGVAKLLTSDIQTFDLPEDLSALDSESYLRQILGSRYSDPKAWPDFIFHTEDIEAEINFLFDLKSLSPKITRIINLDNPRIRMNEFDLVVISSQLPMVTGPNIIRSTGVATWLTPADLASAKAAWEKKLAWMPKPLILAAVGGQSYGNSYYPEFGKDFGARLKSAVQLSGGSVLIASSRRTRPEALAAMIKELSGVPFYVFDWNRDPKEDNPFAGAMALADFVVASGDSHSMMSDVVANGTPFYIHAPYGSLRPDHERMTEDLYVSGRARPFVGNELKKWTYPTINVGQFVVDEINKRFFCDGILAAP